MDTEQSMDGLPEAYLPRLRAPEPINCTEPHLNFCAMRSWIRRSGKTTSSAVRNHPLNGTSSVSHWAAQYRKTRPSSLVDMKGCGTAWAAPRFLMFLMNWLTKVF